MKLYSLYSPSHEALLNDWFLSSLKDDFELEIRKIPQSGSPSGNAYGSPHFIETIYAKIDLIQEAISDNMGGVFVFADIDIQFFGSIRPTLERAIQDNDIVFQRNATNGEINTGFFICRGNERTAALWANTKKRMLDAGDQTEQEILNAFILGDPNTGRNRAWFKYLAPALKHLRLGGMFCNALCSLNQQHLSWGYLPQTFYCPGLSWPKVWKKETPLRLPRGVLMHHANWNAGPTVDEKIAQLDYVCQSVTAGSRG